MKITNENKIGLMVVLVLALLIGITVQTGDFEFSRNRHIVKVSFHNIDGVNLNSPVMFNGFEIGIVKDIIIREQDNETLMECHLWIDEDVRLRTTTEAHIKNLGFMGEKYIGLVSTKDPGPYLSANAVLKGEEPSDFGALLKQGEEIAANVKDISCNLNERFEKNKLAIDGTITHLHETMGNLSSISGNIDERLKVNQHHVDDIMGSVKSAAVNLDELTCDLKNNPWKLTYREKEKRKPCVEEEKK